MDELTKGRRLLIACVMHAAWVVNQQKIGQVVDTTLEEAFAILDDAITFYSGEFARCNRDVARFMEETPAKAHENWMKFKFADGWVYGKKKDKEAKTHPDLVAYKKLPPDEKGKDDVALNAFLTGWFLPESIYQQLERPCDIEEGESGTRCVLCTNVAETFRVKHDKLGTISVCNPCFVGSHKNMERLPEIPEETGTDSLDSNPQAENE